MASMRAFRAFCLMNRDCVIIADVKKEKNYVPEPLNQQRFLRENQSLNSAERVEIGREGRLSELLTMLTRTHKFLYDDAHLAKKGETMQLTAHSADDASQSFVLSP